MKSEFLSAYLQPIMPPPFGTPYAAMYPHGGAYPHPLMPMVNIKLDVLPYTFLFN